MKAQPSYSELEKENAILRKKLIENESNKQFEHYCKNNKAVMLRIDPQTKIITKANNAAIIFYGYTEEELLQKTIYDINLLSNEEIDEKMKGALHSKYNLFQFKHKLADGRIKDVQTYASTFTDAGKMYMIVTVFDITERVKAEKEIRKLSTAVEQSSNVVVITDLKGNIEYANPKFYDLTGYTVNEVLGKNVKILNSGTQSQEYFADMWKEITKGKTWKGEFYNKKKDGSFFWEQVTITPIKNTKGRVINYLAIKEDITERKKAKEVLKNQIEEYASLNEEYLSTNEDLLKAIKKLEESEERYRVFSNASFEAIIISENGVYQEQNKAAEEMFGYSHEEAKQMFATDIFTDESKEIVKKNILSGYLYPYDVVAKRKDGTTFDVEIQGQNFFYKGRNLRITALRDVSIRKKIEKDYIIAKEKAEESDKLKTLFINNMSHEIRTPMNGILGFSELLSNSNISKDKQKQYIEIIQSSSEQLLKIIDDILEISRLGTKKVKVRKHEVCLNDILIQQYSIFKIKAKIKGISLNLKNELPDKQSLIYTDEVKLIKIISNLLENAIKFTNKGFVEFGYTILKKKKISYIQIYVKDTGVGIKKSMQKNIFNRFSQEEKEMSQNMGGLGLGLSISKENAELIGGKISVKSVKNEGATFFITIPYEPIFKKETEDKVIASDKSKQNEDEKITFLIVEDEEVNFLYLDILLEEVYSCSVRLHAKHGKEAIEICKNSNDINLVLMDIKMPVMNGIDATKQIKQVKPNLPIIAQTAYSTKEEKEKAFSAGCDDFISKPINKNELSKMLNKYLVN